MNRILSLAEERIVAAHALLVAKLWSSAYYTTGYAVELGLKSCILVHVANTGVIFQEKKFSEQCWSHDFVDLVKLAGLEAVLETDMTANPLLAANWDVVIKWNEKSRYQQKLQTQAEELYEAITNQPNGVMPWMKVHW